MAENTEGSIWKGDAVFLIIEEIKDQPKPLGLGIPSIKITKDLKLDASHKKLERRVYEAVHEEEIQKDGKRLGKMPGLGEWLADKVSPGHLTSKKTGKHSYKLCYYGYLNKFSMEKNLGVQGSLSVGGFISAFGSDPIPNQILYGNQKIPFQIAGGTGAPTGAAFLAGDKLEAIPTSNKAEIFKIFQAKADQLK